MGNVLFYYIWKVKKIRIALLQNFEKCKIIIITFNLH